MVREPLQYVMIWVSMINTFCEMLGVNAFWQLKNRRSWSDALFGCKTSNGTDLAIFFFGKNVKIYLNSRSPVFLCILDATKTFYRVNDTKLFNVLTTRKVPENLIDITGKHQIVFLTGFNFLCKFRVTESESGFRFSLLIRFPKL